MVVTEYYKTLENGIELSRCYSDEGFYIEREGTLYVDAVDNAEFNRVYTETDIPIETHE